MKEWLPLPKVETQVVQSETTVRVRSQLYVQEAVIVGTVSSANLGDRKTYSASMNDSGRWIGLCEEIPSISFEAATEDEALDGVLDLADKYVAEHGDPGRQRAKPSPDIGKKVLIRAMVRDLSEPDRAPGGFVDNTGTFLKTVEGPTPAQESGPEAEKKVVVAQPEPEKAPEKVEPEVKMELV